MSHFGVLTKYIYIYTLSHLNEQNTLSEVNIKVKLLCKTPLYPGLIINIFFPELSKLTSQFITNIRHMSFWGAGVGQGIVTLFGKSSQQTEKMVD